ncbi:putative peptide deformylase [Helianthus annuus]|nr:putative peptide deformylase [Helianthus annuus]
MIGIQQLPLTGKYSIPVHTPVSITRCQYKPIIKPEFITKNKDRFLSSSTGPVRAGWFLGLGEKKKVTDLPEIVQAGDPVLNEPARDVRPDEIGSERVQKIIDDMVKVMRGAPGVGLAAPQIGIPLKVIINPNLQKKGNKSALFFEGCLSVDGYRAMVERFLDVEVTGLDRYGQPIKVSASGWQARILQHECDHLVGTLYVDKMVKRTFRTVENLQLPLANGCPKPGVR